MTADGASLPTGKSHVSPSEVMQWAQCSWRHKRAQVDKADRFTPSPVPTFGGANLIFSNPGLANGLGEIQYDPFNNKLVFSSEGTQQILRINRDGTGLETIANGVRVRGIYIIPTPSVPRAQPQDEHRRAVA